MLNKRTMVFIGITLFIVLAWASCLFRYDIRIVPNQDGYVLAYRLDRLNGSLRLIEEDQWFPVVEGDPDELRDSLKAPKSSTF